MAARRKAAVHRWSSETWRSRHRSEASPPPGRRSSLALRPAQCAGSRPGSSPRDSVIPEAVMHSRPGWRYNAAHHGREAASHHGSTHVHMDDERADSNQRGAHVQQYGDVAKESQTPGNLLGKPQHNARHQHDDPGPQHYPEEVLLPGVEAIHRRKLFVFVPDVMLHGISPLAID